jgi:hypothetical protein
MDFLDVLGECTGFDWDEENIDKNLAKAWRYVLRM